MPIATSSQPWRRMRAAMSRAVAHAVHFAKEIVGPALGLAQGPVIFDPFCGVGTVLGVANALGLEALGVEKNRKRTEQARELVIRAVELGV